MLAVTMNMIDTTIANVALPHMQGSLSASQDQITWVLTSYIVAQALMTPLTGWVTGRLGRKRVMLISIAGFTAASLACGIATSLPEMVIFRIFQGLCGAAFVPIAQAVMFDINEPATYPRAMAVFGAGIMLGPIIGPVLGGWLTDVVDWRWCFLINLPIGALAFLGVWASLPEKKRADLPRFDFLGYGALALFIASIQLFLDRGPSQDWLISKEIWVYLVLALTGLYFFCVQTATARSPFFSRGLLNDSNFRLGCAFGFFVGVLMYCAMALLPPLLQKLLGLPAFDAGVATVPRGVGMLLSMVMVGRLVGRVDSRLILAVGFALNAFALWQMTQFSPDMDTHLILVSGLIQGLGLGLVFVPMSTISFATVSAELRTEGTSIFTLTRNLGSSAGISFMQALFVRNTQAAHSGLVDYAQPDNPNLQGIGDFALGTLRGVMALDGEFNRQAAMIAYIDDFKVAMLLSLAAIPFLVFLRSPKAAPVEPAHALSE